MKTLLLLALASLPPTARALDWTASAGLIYSRMDNWFEVGDHTYSPHLDLRLKFDLAGYVSSPGIFSYSGGIAWQRISDEANGRSAGITDALTYNVDANLFRHQQSSLTLLGHASRFDTRLQDSPAFVGVGERIEESYGAALSLAPRDLPSSLSGGYERLRSTDDLPGEPLHEATKDIVTANFSHVPGIFGLRAQYRGEWSDGTWAADQNRNFGLTASAQSTISTDSQLFLTDAYYERAPTGTGPGAWGVQTNVFSGGYQRGAERGDQTAVIYSYSRGVTTVGAAATEAQGQSLRAQHDLPLSADETRSWIRLFGDGSMTSQRSVIGTLETSGESVGAQYWRRKAVGGNLWEFGAGPVLGLLQQPDAPSRFGYGATGSVRINRGWGPNQLGGVYTLDYASDLYGRRGWTVRQQASANLAGPAGARGRYRLNLVLGATRAWNPILGDTSTRDIVAMAGYSRGGFNFTVDAGIQSGIAGNAPQEFLGDGLFLPAGFNSHTSFLRATGSALLYPGLTSRLQFLGTDRNVPDQPALTGLEGIGALVYHYGAFDLSIEDRVTLTQRSGGTSRQNLVLFRVARTIGNNF